MATFNNIIITREGKKLYAKAIAGKTIQFTKAILGSGAPSSVSEAEALNALVRAEITGAITINTEVLEGVAVVSVSLSNAGLDNPLPIKEIGLFCKDPDTGAEAMYAYCYSEDDLDVIPSKANGETEWKMQLHVYISNATGEATTQTELIPFTPTVTPTATDGTIFLSNVVAECEYITKGSLVTAFYNITGALTNMELAESKLSGLTISLPQKSAVSCAVCSRMVVQSGGNAPVAVDILGGITKHGVDIVIDYFGSQNGNFSLMLTAQYAM